MIVRTRIVVTESDIANGIKSNCTACPIARAVNRRLKTEFYSSASAGLSIWKRSDETAAKRFQSQILVPSKIYDFMNAFDNGKYVKSFHFTVGISQEFLK